MGVNPAVDFDDHLRTIAGGRKGRVYRINDYRLLDNNILNDVAGTICTTGLGNSDILRHFSIAFFMLSDIKNNQLVKLLNVLWTFPIKTV